MFVGISAGRLGALITKYPFTHDASGRLFQRCIARLGLSDYDENILEPKYVKCWVTNLVKGRVLKPSGRNRLPTKMECDYWWPMLQTEITVVRPKKIIAMGKLVGDYLKTKKITQEIVVVAHPRWYQAHGALSYGSDAFELMVTEYRKACGL